MYRNPVSSPKKETSCFVRLKQTLSRGCTPYDCFLGAVWRTHSPDYENSCASVGANSTLAWLAISAWTGDPGLLASRLKNAVRLTPFWKSRLQQGLACTIYSSLQRSYLWKDITVPGLTLLKKKGSRFILGSSLMESYPIIFRVVHVTPVILSYCQTALGFGFLHPNIATNALAVW